MSRNDELNSRAEQIADAREEGFAEGKSEGKAEGRAEGRYEERAEIIRSIYSKGINAEEISRMLDMNIEDVKNILGL